MENDNYELFPCGLIKLGKDYLVKYINPELLLMSHTNKKAWLHMPMNKLPFFEITNTTGKRINFLKCIGKSDDPKMHKSAMMRTTEGKYILVFLTGKKTGHNEFLICVTDISKEINCSTGNTPELTLISDSPLSSIVGKDEKILALHKLIELAADSIANAMITGESGTGKELVAKAIHQLSSRKNKPFITVNCSALTETLLESELFGHVKGSFTGAYKDKIGKFESASEGTVFLDEIGEISPMLQVKLLRVIQEKTIERVGDNKLIKVNMRIIAATNKNLRDLVNKGLFREDLFYRLNVFPIHTVPLREHKNDIPLLCTHFIERFNKQTGKNIKGLTEDAFRIMLDYCWPGNVRELENSIEHAFVICNKLLIDVFDLPQDVRLVSLRQGLCKGIDTTNKPAYFYSDLPSGGAKSNPLNLRNPVSKDQLIALLETNHWNKTITAQQLGISRVALWKKMKKMGL
jgi:two-component system, NtrC family, response regulator HydG